MRRGALAIVGLLLACAALPAPAQATRPAAADDPYKDMLLPIRRGATTQASGAAVTAEGTTDLLDTKRLALALGIVLVAIFISHQVWKRMGMPGAAGRASGTLQVVSRLNITPKQQIMLVRVGRRLVLIGNSGGQMNSLCEIGDPEEAAALLGQTAVEREGSVSTSFKAVLGGEEKHFEDPAETMEQEEEDPAVATTREEIHGLMEKVKGMSKQFRGV